jgi:hypothetical protein
MKKLLLSVIAFAAAYLISNAQSIDDSFFEHVDFRGAFGTDNWTAGWANFDPQNTSYAAVTDTVEAGDISSNTTWTSDKVYLLNGWIYVTDGATLTIEAGTVIRGDKVNKGALIVEPGGMLMAQGTLEHPIVFTSNQDAGSRTYGDWGGVILCGKATVNKVDPQIEGGPRTHYGGTADDDNSGTLTYVRIEFPGIAFQPDKEINGLTFGAVGSSTTIDYIQISYSGDDSYEWFGGKVDCNHLIAFRGWDDDYDTDYGYHGRVQYAVSLRDPAIADPGSGSNGFESDNDGSGSDDTPYTTAVFSNVSMFGPLVTPSTTINDNYKRAMHLRRNTRLQIYNTIFAGYLTGLYIEGPSVQAAQDGDLKLYNNIIAGTTTDFGAASGEWTPAEEATWYFTSDFENDTLPSNGDLGITDPFDLSSPNFLPASGSMVLTGSYWYEVPPPPDDLNNHSAKIVQAYPNPVHDVLTIDNSLGVKSVVIVNTVGQVVKQAYNTNTVKVNNLNAGIYLIIVIDTNGLTYYQRIVKN